ncbi:MAG: hypothetical protein AAFR61_07235 [Bacteroidota bacterium]
MSPRIPFGQVFVRVLLSAFACCWFGPVLLTMLLLGIGETWRSMMGDYILVFGSVISFIVATLHSLIFLSWMTYADKLWIGRESLGKFRTRWMPMYTLIMLVCLLLTFFAILTETRVENIPPMAWLFGVAILANAYAVFLSYTYMIHRYQSKKIGQQEAA